MPLSVRVPVKLFSEIIKYSTDIIARMPLPGSAPVKWLWKMTKFLTSFIVVMPPPGSAPVNRLNAILNRTTAMPNAPSGSAPAKTLW
eukprot:3874164-Amphidinium_carterae.1